jgi:hypothetical protein
MAGLCPNLWARLLLAGLLSFSLPGNMGESYVPVVPSKMGN